MPLIDDNAICVRTWDWSETSQTAVLLTRNHGMIRVLAKGSKRDRSAFSGGLEICTVGSMSAIVKPNSELALLTQWDLLGPMLGIRRSLTSYNAALLGVDLIPRLIQDHDPHEAVHDALIDLLQFCDDFGSQCHDFQQDVYGVLAWFLWSVLVAVGAMPIVDHDVLTGESLVLAEVYGFSAQFGGITQDPITQNGLNHDASGDSGEGVWRIRAKTVEMMNGLGQRPPVSRFLRHSMDQNRRLACLLGSYIRERTGTEIPAMDWLLDRDRG